VPIDIPRIGRIARSAREGMDLSQSELAKKIGFSKQAVNALENDQCLPKYEMFYKLVRALNISADLFIYSDRAQNTPEQEQFIHEMLTCSEHERNVLRSLLRARRHDVTERQD
jgi:transcriptional regulator with XRE-family HTH domain